MNKPFKGRMYSGIESIELKNQFILKHLNRYRDWVFSDKTRNFLRPYLADQRKQLKYLLKGQACSRAYLQEIDVGNHQGLPLHFHGADLNADSVALNRTPYLQLKSQEIQRRNDAVDDLLEWTPDGRIVFSWRSEDHPELFRHSSSQRPSNYRITSFDLDPDGNIIMAFYNQSEIVKIEYPSGRVLFEISEETWKYSHDPLLGVVTPHSLRVLPDRHLLVFDDGDGSSRPPARAVEYKLDEQNRTAEWVWEYHDPTATQDMTRVGGSVQRLANGHTVIGWGIATDIKKRLPKNPQSYLLMSEVDSNDRVVREISADHPMASYRVFYLDQSRSGNRL